MASSLATGVDTLGTPATLDMALPTASPTSSPTSSTATPAASKRTAKQLKKKQKAAADAARLKSSDDSIVNDMDDDATGNNLATVDHPYLSFLHKRIRLYRKKLEKIKLLENAQAASNKVLNSQQRELVNSKTAVEKIVNEFELLREQFIGVYLEEEASKQKQAATHAQEAAAAAAAAVETLVDVIVAETVAELTHNDASSSTTAMPAVAAVTAAVSAAAAVEASTERVVENESDTADKANDAVALSHVRDLLKALHVVNLHHALGKDVPMVLDFFAKVLLGNTRPVAEVSFTENLAESIEEARKYVAQSDKIMACGATYVDLRATVDVLAQQSGLDAGDEDAGNKDASEMDAADATALPPINFFTDSLLDATTTDDKSDEHADALEEMPAVDAAGVDDKDEEEGMAPANDSSSSSAVDSLAPSPASLPVPMSFATIAATAPAAAAAWGTTQSDHVAKSTSPQQQQQRRPKSADRSRRIANSATDSNTNGHATYSSNSSNGANGANGNGAIGSNTKSTSSMKDDRRVRLDRSMRVHRPQLQAHASPQA